MATTQILPSEPSTLHVPTFRIEVTSHSTHHKTHSIATAQADVTYRVGRLYFLRGQLSMQEVERLARELLVDPVVETFNIAPVDEVDTPSRGSEDCQHIIDVTLLPGVTDPVAENLVRAAHLLGIAGVEQAATGERYFVWAALTEGALRKLATENFLNPVIQRFTVDGPISPPFVPFQQTDDTVDVIPLRHADDETLVKISGQRRLALNLAEMQAIRAYFQQEARDPTDVELETLAQTWSEHCSHKTFKALIDYTDQTGQRTIDGLLKTTIRAATERIAKLWVHSAFVDNAGVIAFDDQWDLAFKVETHNHPSALEPFGGANTGVGGVVRDILGVSARPIANTDVLCFGPQTLPDSDLPTGVLHPRRIQAGVVRGVEDYGNKMGIPTVNGAIIYHTGYTSNPLVFCGCIGLLPHSSHVTQPEPGDLIVVIGGKTGRDGLRGATFSSMEMDTVTSEIAGSAVQIGHPINEKQVLEVVLQARDARLYHAITDCGAGGLSSAVGEMARPVGARVQLENVPLKYPGLRPWEIWLSEAQERMVLAIPPENWPRFQQICEAHGVEAVSIGTLEATDRLRLFYGENPVGDLAMDFLHDGLPRHHLKAIWTPPEPTITQPVAMPDLADSLLKLLAHPNIASKEAVIRRYDHEVQSGTAVKPLVGVDNHGPGDAAVLVPLDTMRERIAKGSDPISGVALSAGVCPAYGEREPYLMAWAAVDEAMRNVVAVGADPDRVALLDNFCWGNPNLPDRLGGLVRCAIGCHDAAVAYNAPFISGKDSLNNEYTAQDGTRHAIPGTLLISAIGIVPDVARSVTMDLKRTGNRLYIVGDTHAELGGSHFALISDQGGGALPEPVPNALDRLRALHRAIAAGLVEACHDCSEGGIGVTLAEMCLAGRLGATLWLDRVPGIDVNAPDHAILFSESLCRFVVEVSAEQEQAFSTMLEGVPHAMIGTVENTGTLTIERTTDIPNGEREVRAKIDIGALEEAWRGTLIPRQDENATGTRGLNPLSGEQLKVVGVLKESDLASTPPAVPKQSKPAHSAPAISRSTRVLILHTVGTNRDRDAALACELAGAAPEIVTIGQLLSGERHLSDYHMLVVPGGFSYGDDLGAGKVWALDLQHRLTDTISAFVRSGRPVIGICNGFQALVKAGLLPGPDWAHPTSADNAALDTPVTLTYNASGHFECRWVKLWPNPNSPSIFTDGLDEPIYCPVAHGEGRLVARDDATRAALWNAGLAPLLYVDDDNRPAGYPGCPNGSDWAIGGLCNPAGNVLGLMPHPENHIFPWQHPRWQRGERGMLGLRLFENGIRYARR